MRRRLQNTYVELGVQNQSAAIAAAAKLELTHVAFGKDLTTIRHATETITMFPAGKFL